MNNSPAASTLYLIELISEFWTMEKDLAIGVLRNNIIYPLDLQDYFLLVAQPAETTCGANLYSSTIYI